MKNRITIQLLTTILIYSFLIGCPRDMVKPETRQYESLPTLSQQKIEKTQNDLPKTTNVEFAGSDSVDFQPAPVEQLHSALVGLESFRVFGYHFKIQNDQEMLKSLKKPTFEYIAKNIDPHLKLKKIVYDPTSEMYIASFLYMKAYLFWVHDDEDSARKTIAVLNRTFPQRHSDIMIHHFDKGDISLDDALDEFENLIGPEPTKK